MYPLVGEIVIPNLSEVIGIDFIYCFSSAVDNLNGTSITPLATSSLAA